MNPIDLQDIEKLFKENHKRLCNVVNRIINNREAAEDVVQEMFIKLWRKKDELTIESSLKGYLFKMASHAAINYLETNKRFKLNEEITDRNSSELVVNESNYLEGKELADKIEQAIKNLPPKCKAIFLLSRYEGMKYQEIADHLNLSLKTVENQMGIALQKLREDLTNYLAA
jgi:RNA polymerase sigma-70 factor (ECF subfamily)